MLVPLECLIPCRSIADWRRRKHQQDPEDWRSSRAAAVLASWEADVRSLNGSPVHQRLVKLWEAEEGCDGERDAFSVVVAEELRAVGVSSFPLDAAELLESIANRLDRANGNFPLEHALSQGRRRSSHR